MSASTRIMWYLVIKCFQILNTRLFLILILWEKIAFVQVSIFLSVSVISQALGNKFSKTGQLPNGLPLDTPKLNRGFSDEQPPLLSIITLCTRYHLKELRFRDDEQIYLLARCWKRVESGTFLRCTRTFYFSFELISFEFERYDR